MRHYLQYLLSPVILVIGLYGLYLGGNYSWTGLGILLGVLFLDAFWEPDFSIRDTRYPWLYDLIISITVGMGFAGMLLYCYFVGGNHFATTSSAVGAFVTMAFMQFVVVAPPLHELFHRENLALRWLGRLGMVMLFDPWREITHVVTHHMRVATPDDPDYARRGDVVYAHIVRTLYGQIKEAYHLEKAVWTKRGRTWWDPRNAWVWRSSTLVLFAGLLFAIGGAKAMLLSIAVCIVGPRSMLEVFNYCNHYGLVSATPGRFEKRHTWNHLTPLVRVLALEITNHAGHHEDSYKPFYELVPDRTGPRQPQFLMCVLMAFVPPVWFMAIKPLLRDWDERFANQQERELAQAENARAGWHDLNEPYGSNTGLMPVAAAA